MRQRVAILAFDALDFDLVRGWVAEGRLPTFARLLDGTLTGDVVNPLGFEAGSVWPTFTTGQPVAVHGQYDGPYRFDTTAYELRLLRYDERAAVPFWVDASAAGRRVAIVDVPYVLLDEVNGVHVVDWLTHVRTNPPGIAASPAAEAEAIVGRYGANPFHSRNRCPTNDASVDTAEAVVALRDSLLQRIAWKEAYCAELWRREPWDLFVAAFHDAHDIGHMCWHLHDPGHERHDAALAARVGDPVRDVYVTLDAALGRLLALLGEEPLVLVYSSHGMGRQRTASRLLDDILARLDEHYRGGSPAAAEPARRGWAERVAPVYCTLVPPAVRRRLLGSRAARVAYKNVRRSELSRRLFFELAANHATGGVRFNLKGRESAGTVAPGAELAALRQRLTADLAAVENAETGEPLVREVIWTRDLYDGPRSDHLPDMLLEWNTSAPIRRVRSPLIGTIDDHFPRNRSGDHTSKRGMFLAKGPGVPAGRLNQPVPVAAFAPTIAALLGYDAGGYALPPIALTREPGMAEAS